VSSHRTRPPRAPNAPERRALPMCRSGATWRAATGCWWHGSGVRRRSGAVHERAFASRVSRGAAS